MRAPGRNVLGELGQEVQRREDLEISLGIGDEAVSIRIGKGPARLLLGLVDHLPGFGDLDSIGIHYCGEIGLTRSVVRTFQT